jgi:ABC-2 type transport system permease protein
MNLTYLRVECLRLLRNRRALILSILMPSLLLTIFGGMYKQDSLNGVGAASYLMVSMGLFGAMLAAMGTGGTIALERGVGWNRQLRLTPLRPWSYLATKTVVSLLVALPPLFVTFALAALTLDVRLPAITWAEILVVAWLSVLPFTAVGILIGYVAKPDSVQQFSALFLLVIAVFGGIWVPTEQMPDLMRRIGEWTPAFWGGQAARSPLFHEALSGRAVAMVLGWTLVLGLVAMWRFRRDTARA